MGMEDDFYDDNEDEEKESAGVSKIAKDIETFWSYAKKDIAGYRTFSRVLDRVNDGQFGSSGAPVIGYVASDITGCDVVSISLDLEQIPETAAKSTVETLLQLHKTQLRTSLEEVAKGIFALLQFIGELPEEAPYEP